MLRIDVVTIFPELFEPFRAVGVLGGAIERGLLSLAAHDLRRWTRDRHRTVDDIPYGGGPGMVMKPEPLVEAAEELAGPKRPLRAARVLLLAPQGARFHQAKAAALARESHLVLLCGRYEGVDQRASELAADEELSIGDYVVSGGEAPAMVVIEAVSRLLPGVLGNPESSAAESFQQGALEAPHYTRPAEFRGCAVPEVLRSGDHGRIRAWRATQSKVRTQRRRPDLQAAPCQTGEQ
ncbi:MAG: tRNA (guanosine(37)-N1)-methyltransferase TrmD [Deltaproteobacteria bacterium]|nr:tRNA (guanosine(37)-N1)-methyltransferase TrmD [Deltaproteobacteria bacterium]MDD9872994.1 tRNA (guanosine(37)-N1)-methyltransferase TrmD [Deltaproteobacteria bacterium]